jgi:hypothetical protein
MVLRWLHSRHPPTPFPRAKREEIYSQSRTSSAGYLELLQASDSSLQYASILRLPSFPRVMTP